LVKKSSIFADTKAKAALHNKEINVIALFSTYAENSKPWSLYRTCFARFRIVGGYAVNSSMFITL